MKGKGLGLPCLGIMALNRVFFLQCCWTFQLGIYFLTFDTVCFALLLIWICNLLLEFLENGF